MKHCLLHRVALMHPMGHINIIVVSIGVNRSQNSSRLKRYPKFMDEPGDDDFRYTGETNSEGLPHGHGKIEFDIGISYEGQFKDGMMHGHGVYLFYPDLEEWADHLLYRYEGEFKENKKCGIGKTQRANGDCYIGEFRNDVMHGIGRETYGAVEDYYKGEWKHGQKEGIGLYVYANGAHYRGEWKSGNKHGKGILQYTNGDYYDGEWEYGVEHGHGYFAWISAGAYHHGEWKQGKYHGHGVHNYGDGTNFSGQWKDGLRYGWGVYTNHLGERIEKNWDDHSVLNSFGTDDEE